MNSRRFILDMGTSSPVGGVFVTEKRQAMALGYPHAQPAAERPASPWDRPESF